MAIPTFVAAGTYVSTTLGTLTPGLPSGWAIDDILIITHFSRSGPGTAPTGYAEIISGGEAMSGASGRVQVYWKRAVSGETAQVIGAVGNACAQMVAYRGCKTTGDFFEAAVGGVQNTAGTSFSSTGLTTLGADRLYWCSVGRSGDDTNPRFSSWASTNASNVLERIDDGFSEGTGGGTAGAEGGAATTGAYGPFTATIGISAKTAWIEFALIPTANTISGSFTADAVLFKTQTGSLTANAVLKTTLSGSFVADAITRKTQSGSFTANAFVQPYFLADATFLKSQSGSFTANAVLRVGRTGSITGDSVFQTTQSGSFIADAILKKTVSGSFTADAWIGGLGAGAFTADAILKAIESGSLTASAVFLKTQSGTVAANAVLLRVQTGSLAADAILKQNQSSSVTADAVLAVALVTITGSFTGDSVLKKTASSSLTADAIKRKSTSSSFTANAIKRITVSGSKTADAILKKRTSSSLTVDAYIVYNRMRHNRWTEHTGLDRDANHILAQAFGIYLKDENLEAVLAEIDARITAREGHYLHLLKRLTGDAILKKIGTAGSFSADAVLKKTISGSFTADAILKKTIFADAWILDPAIYIADDVTIAPTWAISTTPRAAFISTASLTHDAVNDPPWWDTVYLSGWAKFTLSATHTVRIDTIGTQGDSVIQLWSGSPGSWPSNPIASGDDNETDPTNPYGFSESIQQVLTAGTYYVAVHPFDEPPSPDFNILLRMQII